MDRNETNIVLAERIGKLRVLAGESQQSLADNIGVKRETVKFWESGERHIKCGDIAKLAKHFNVSADYLLGLSDVVSPDTGIRSVCDYTGLSEKSVDNIREINREDLDDGLNLILEGRHFIDVVECAADLLRRCKYIAEGNARFQEMENKAKAIQKENPELSVFYGRDMLEYDISEAEKGLRDLLRHDSLYALLDIDGRLQEWEADNGEHTEN